MTTVEMAWKTRPLSECGEWVSGGTPSKSVASYWNGDIPWISSKSLKTFDLSDSEDRISQKAVKNGTRLLPKGAVVFVVRGMSLANEFRVGVTTREVAFNQDLRAIIPRSDMDGRFLAQFLRARERVIMGMTDNASHGTKRLPTELVETIRVPVPPLSEQRRIAAILDKADSIRRKREEGIRLTEELLRSTFLEMFGDPATNPKNWSSRPLQQLVKWKSGEFLPAKAMQSTGTHAVYGGNGITGYHDSFMFDKPVIVLGRVGAYCGAVHYTKPKSWVTDNALYAAEKSSDLIDGFLVSALHQANLNQYSNSSGQPLISGQRISNVPILVPPLALQQRYCVATKKIDCLLESRQKGLEESKTLFDALVQCAFRGEL